MRWSPNTTGGSRFFVTKAEYPVSALDGRDGYGSDAEYLPRRPRSHIQISATGRSRHSRYPACPVRFKSGHSSSRRPGGESPHPGRSCGRCGSLEDAADDRAVGEHVGNRFVAT